MERENKTDEPEAVFIMYQGDMQHLKHTSQDTNCRRWHPSHRIEVETQLLQNINRKRK